MDSPLSLDKTFLNKLLFSKPDDSWRLIQDLVWKVMSQPVVTENPDLEISMRDRAIGKIDSALLSSWELWKNFHSSVERGSESIKEFWKDDQNGKAILILDAMSLRETPWLLDGFANRGYKIESAKAVASEIPSETTEFAKAIGFNQRSSLGDNKTDSKHTLPDAKTFSCDLPWDDCSKLIGSERNIIFWHHWPDSRIHDLSEPGDGFQRLIKEGKEILTSDNFWNFLEFLSNGRKMLITSDHGYAASGLFVDVSDKNQSKYLKENYKSGRSKSGTEISHEWVPPLEIALNNVHGERTFVLGRKKWKSTGGYPTLMHGGLTLLEILKPEFIVSK